jgi:lysophospholipase L1-like esterase
VRRLLAGKANVYRPMGRNGKGPANCGDTRTGLKGIETWLGTRHWDVIHFNWGLWDLCYRNPASTNQGNRDKEHGKLTATPEEYERNLETLVARLEKTGAKLIWASTTAVPPNEFGRFEGDDAKYNAVAARVMQRHGIPTDDLFAVTKSFGGKLSAAPGDVHYTDEGYERIAEAVSKSIAAVLPPKR